MNPRISVIVPVYNTEKYLSECVDSILAQTFTGFELLLIDDGSSDNSGAICDEYAVKDSRIRVFHKLNGGVSSARNLGLDNARGEWIIFIDGDDYWNNPDMLDSLYDMAIRNSLDIVRFEYACISPEGDLSYPSNVLDKVKYNDTDKSTERMLSNIFKDDFFCWLLFIKRSIIGELSFNNKLNFFEDKEFILRMLVLDELKLGYINRPYYIYRKSLDSAIFSSNEKIICDALDLCYCIWDLSHDIVEKNKRIYYIKLAVMSYYTAIWFLGQRRFIKRSIPLIKKTALRRTQKDILNWIHHTPNSQYPIQLYVHPLLGILLLRVKWLIDKIKGLSTL